MTIRINSRIFLLAVTGFVAVFIVLLPFIDRRVCRRLGLNLQHGLSQNPNADALLRLRQLVLRVQVRQREQLQELRVRQQERERLLLR